MVARHYYRYDQDEPVAEVPTVLRWGYTAGEKAEEGEAGIIEVVVDDPDMTLDFAGHRRWLIFEDDSDDAENEVIFSGLTQSVSIAHKGGDITNPGGRVWTIQIADMNTLWTYRIMRGSDTDRPAETDVERMTWLAGTEEFGYFGSLPLLSTGSPVSMDEAETRGQTTGSVADSCAQQSGKNWWIGSRGLIADVPTSVEIFLWYGHDSLSAYASPLSLSNDPDDLDMAAVDAGTATTYPIGADTTLNRDYARQYSGAYGEYQNGAVYVEDPVTVDLITVTKRDMSYPAPDVKSKARMKARLQRVLRDHRGPDEVISTTIELPGNKVSQLRAGMRVPFKATHEPGYETSVSMRVMTAKPSPLGRKSGVDWYKVALELQGPGIPAVVPGSCSTVIGGTENVSEIGLETDPNPTVGITPTNSAILIAWLASANQNSTGSEDMAAISGGYTELLDVPVVSKSTYRIAAKAGSAGVLSTASSSFTPGFSASGGWIAAQVAIGLSSGTPVQSKYLANARSLTLDAPPTTGNVVLVFAHLDSGWGLLPNADTEGGPTTGWVELFNRDWDVPGNTRLNLAIFARCVEAGETGEYSFSQTVVGYSTARSIFVAEFAP